MHYFISAGEASGDLHAAQLMAELHRLDPDARFTFLGGDMMASVAGHEPLIHIRRMAYMGFVDVAIHLRAVLGNLSLAKKQLRESDIDALIVVDYPSFNLKLAAEAVRKSIPVFGYISPKVWAWKEGRIPRMRKLMRHLYSILPFEPDYFARHDFPAVTYVGNPSREEVDSRLAGIASREEFLAGCGIDPAARLLALLPGSRIGEIKANLPVMAEVARRHPELTAVVAGAPSIDRSLYQSICPLPVVEGASFELLRYAEAALVTSGTATLEAALLGTPQVACYRANGSRVAYALFKRILKIPFVTLPNLICGREVIPEMLVHKCTPDAVDSRLIPLLDAASAGRTAMLEDYADLRRRLGTTPAAATTAASIVGHLRASS